MRVQLDEVRSEKVRFMHDHQVEGSLTLTGIVHRAVESYFDEALQDAETRYLWKEHQRRHLQVVP